MDYKEKKKSVEQFQKVLSRGLYSETELSIISETFFDNENLLTALRNFFLQLPLDEVSLITSFADTPAYGVLKSTFLPELSPDSPIGRNADMWAGINTTEKLPEDSILEMRARDIVISYLEQQFENMKEGKEYGKIKLVDLVYSKDKSPSDAFIDLSARNSIIGQVNGNLMNLRELAFKTKTKMTNEEIQKIMMSNSNK